MFPKLFEFSIYCQRIATYVSTPIWKEATSSYYLCVVCGARPVSWASFYLSYSGRWICSKFSPLEWILYSERRNKIIWNIISICACVWTDCQTIKSAFFFSFFFSQYLCLILIWLCTNTQYTCSIELRRLFCFLFLLLLQLVFDLFLQLRVTNHVFQTHNHSGEIQITANVPLDPGKRLQIGRIAEHSQLELIRNVSVAAVDVLVVGVSGTLRFIRNGRFLVRKVSDMNANEHLQKKPSIELLPIACIRFG